MKINLAKAWAPPQGAHLLHQRHLFHRGQIPCFNLIEINSRRQLAGVKIDLVGAGLFVLVHHRHDMLTAQIKDVEPHPAGFFDAELNRRLGIERIRIILLQFETGRFDCRPLVADSGGHGHVQKHIKQSPAAAEHKTRWANITIQGEYAPGVQGLKPHGGDVNRPGGVSGRQQRQVQHIVDMNAAVGQRGHDQTIHSHNVGDLIRPGNAGHALR